MISRYTNISAYIHLPCNVIDEIDFSAAIVK